MVISQLDISRKIPSQCASASTGLHSMHNSFLVNYFQASTAEGAD